MSRYLVTGASGYIGSRLATWLVRRGHSVHAVVRPQSDRRRLRELEDRGSLEVYDGTAASVTRMLERTTPDVVFHVATQYVPEAGLHDPREVLEANLVFATQVLHALGRLESGAFVNTGTFSQHLTGDDTYAPVDLYAATKQAFEQILQYYVDAEGVRAVTLKLFDVYGPRDHRRRLLPLLGEAAASGIPLPMTAGDQLVDMVYIDDVLHAYETAAHLVTTRPDEVAGRCFAVSSGSRRPLRDVVRLYEHVSGRPVPVLFGARPYRPRQVMSPWRGTRLPGWQPAVGLEEGFRRVLADMD